MGLRGTIFAQNLGFIGNDNVQTVRVEGMNIPPLAERVSGAKEFFMKKAGYAFLKR